MQSVVAILNRTPNSYYQKKNKKVFYIKFEIILFNLTINLFKIDSV